MPAINTPTLQKANVPECKEIFENFQENFPGIRCFQCRKIHVLIYTQKIEILAPLFYKIFLNKNLTNKKYALRRIKKRSGQLLSRPIHIFVHRYLALCIINPHPLQSSEGRIPPSVVLRAGSRRRMRPARSRYTFHSWFLRTFQVFPSACPSMI